MKRQKITLGSIIKIPVKEGIFTYGRILEGKIAVYNSFTDTELSAPDILTKEILFVVLVDDNAITQGRWEKIGKPFPLEPPLQADQLPPMYRQDHFNPQKIQLVFPDRFESANAEACAGLEKWAVWTPEAIETRLRDHLEGKSNAFLEMDLKKLGTKEGQ